MAASSSDEEEDEPAAEGSSEEARASRLKRLRATHAATVGRLEELHGLEAPPSGSREARARAVAQLCKDAAMAGESPKDNLGRPAVIGQGGDPVQYAAALEAAGELVADFPEWDESHYQLGLAHLGAEEWDEALVAYEAAVKINPGHIGARAALASKEEYDRENRARDTRETRKLSLETVHAALERLPGPGGYRRNQVLLVSGLKGAPQHNGKSGKCLSFNAAKGRWNVELSTDEVIGLKPACVAPEVEVGGTGLICDAGHPVEELPAEEEEEEDGEEYEESCACAVCGEDIGRSACFGCIECEDYTVCVTCQVDDACADTPERRVQLAAEQKAAGNGAFGTGDWDRALSCYASSVGLSDACCKISAKTYSNLAATLCKLSLYKDASSCAERSTAIDSSWAKGWWRRGVVDTLQRKFMGAVGHYEKALELEPDSEVFIEAHKKAMSMISKHVAQGKNVDGGEGRVRGTAENNLGTTMHKEAMTTGPPAVWRKVQTMGWDAWHLTNQVEGVTPSMMQSFRPEGTDAVSVKIQNTITSETFLVLGLRDYVTGMRGGLASLVLSVGPSAGASPACKQARDQFYAMGGTSAAGEQCLGGDPYGGFDQLFSGIVHLCGKNIWLEQHTVTPEDPEGRRNAVNPDHCLCPPHPLLHNILGQQMLAMTLMIANRHMDCVKVFGRNMLEPAAIQSAIYTCKANMGQAPNKAFQATKVSVAATLKYIKKCLKSGITWDAGVRKLVSLYYRGSLIYAILARFIGDAGGAYEHIAWAVDFIEAMDKTYGVVKDGSFSEKGSAFQPSIRRSIMLMQLETHAHLRGNGSFSLTGGAFPVGVEIDLCLAVIKSATEHAPHKLSGFGHVMHDAAFRRNPLATAHATLASLLSQMLAHIRLVGSGDNGRLEVGGENFHAFMTERGLYEHSADLYAIIAEQYRCCAKVQFRTADDAAILWWGHAGNMARAEGRGDGKPGKYYTLGELRHAVAMAREAHALRDKLLFGEDDSAGGTFEAQALVVEQHFAEEDDAFELQQKLELAPGSKPGHMAMLIDGVVVCEDMHQYVAADAARRKTKDDDKLRDEAVDEVERAHGAAPAQGVQKLALLCVRELHRQGHECALDEADPTEVAAKLVAMAASQ